MLRAEFRGRPILAGIAGLAVALSLCLVLPDYWAFLTASALVAATTLLGLGIVTGTAGMIALCQMSFVAIGAWVFAGLNLVDMPGGAIVWLLLGAAAAGVLGLLVGLPALRVRGVNLAVVTLGFAAALDVLLVRVQFPGAADFVPVERPALLGDESAFLLFAAAVFVVAAVSVSYLRLSRIGVGWRMVAYSERALASSGGSVRATKLSAFAVSAALAGLAGGVLMLQVGFGSPAAFTPLQSLAMFLLATVVGAQLVDMAVLGGLLWVGIPEILKRVGIDQNWALVVFAAMGIQALGSRTTLGAQARTLLLRRRESSAPRLRLAEAADSAARVERGPAQVRDRSESAALSARGLSVSFGKVIALDAVHLDVRPGEVVALIGPNGAGKSTLIDALTGFLPAAGAVELDSHDISRLAPAARARSGLRRTYQVDRVPMTLTVGQYVRFVSRRRLTSAAMSRLLDAFGCPPPATSLADTDSGTRRIVELVAQLASEPRVLLLDEPAAGLSHDEHAALAALVAAIPSTYGTAVLIIEHDLDLVRRVADRVVVLDFGRVIAEGDPASVLSDPAVLKAYMGDAGVSA